MIYLVSNQIVEDNDKWVRASVEEALALLTPLTKVGLDIETMGLDPYTKDLALVQLGCYEFQIVIDCTTVDINLFKDYLESDRLFIGWNIKFDMKFLFHKRIVLKNVYDGFIAEKLMWMGYPSGFHSMSLKSAGENYLGIELDNTVRGRIMWGGLGEAVVEYAANDVKYLEKLMDAQALELEKKGLSTAIIYENKSVPWIAYTEYCGVKLDVQKWQYKMKLDNFIEAVFEKALNEWIVASALGEKYAYHYLQVEGLSEKAANKARAKMKGERCPEKDIKGSERGYCEAYKVPIETQVSTKFIHEEKQGDLFVTASGEKLIGRIRQGAFREVFVPFFAEQNFNYILNEDEALFADTFKRLLAVMEASENYIVDQEQEDMLKAGDVQGFFADICKKYIVLV